MRFRGPSRQRRPELNKGMETEHSSAYSISDLESLSGVKAHTIRIWEKRYKVFTPRRTDTNIRYYSNEDLKKLLNISLLIKTGHKISELSALPATALSEKVSSILLPETDSRNERLLMSLLEMDEILFNKVFENLVKKEGFEQAIIDTVFPFFQRVGLMWQCGTINPAQEHFFSNLVKSKIIYATEKMRYDPLPGVQTIVLFLPEGELHEIALLFYNYAFRKRGYRTIYLGQSVPFESLERIFSISSPDAIVTGVTTAALQEGFTGFCKMTCRQAGKALVYFTGPVPDISRKGLPRNARFTGDLIDTLNLTPPESRLAAH
ncbi:B12 binding protein [Taibaiella chishuiensis]|uniref:B12 binding protein n=2 Tax=Taibaiella chishuiensis TaxID=1434707 RepID=A0A2P8D8N1_9BACT|nr:B12 binding protein [Taibaiella chishuiensis]